MRNLLVKIRTRVSESRLRNPKMFWIKVSSDESSNTSVRQIIDVTKVSCL